LRLIKTWVLVVVAVALTSCRAASSESPPKPVPAAVTALIHELETQPVANPPAYVASYEYAGQVVYYVPPRCCDIFGDLYNAAGVLVCHPDGGLGGRGDGRCPDFFSQRKNETIVWRDPRKA
jgi:hypothetical protein